MRRNRTVASDAPQPEMWEALGAWLRAWWAPIVVVVGAPLAWAWRITIGVREAQSAVQSIKAQMQRDAAAAAEARAAIIAEQRETNRRLDRLMESKGN